MSVERQLLMAASGVSTQYTIAKSLRFRSSASAYLSRTYPTAGSTTTWTYSTWIKRGALGALQDILRSYYTSINHCGIYFQTNDTLNMVLFSGSVGINLITTQVFRDPSAWYHLVFSVDTTQATASNRVKIYVNGVQITSFSTATYPAQNSDTYMCSSTGWTHVIGKFYDFGTTSYLDGYMAEINFIDGQALTPSSFGETSSTTGVWIPKQYSGSYGTNGFYLKFTDTTSTTTLGNDSSGNGNNWTPNNLSLTTGSTYDSMLDSPTNYDNGGNGVGNYAVLNPLNMESGLTMYWANLYGYTASSWKCCTSTIAVTSGKWYWEVLYTAGSSYGMFGISNTAFDASTGGFWSKAGGYAYYSTGDKYIAGSTSSYGASYSGGDVIGFALDMDAGTLTCYKNNVSQGVLSSGISGAVVPAFAVYNGGFQPTFGQRPFAYTPPTGYKALNTQNLSAPSIVNGAGYMAATLYTGNGATNLTVANANNSVSFQPGFVWIKKRGPGTANHCLNNEVMGVGTGVSLYTASTSAAGAYDIYGYLSALTSTGFTTQKGTDPTYPNDLVNESGSTYVAWQWKANGTAVTNTAGSITSSVSANTTSGFSVVTYTGTLSSAGTATVGHGLGVAPDLIITKARSSTSDWVVHHKSLSTPSYALALNLTDAQVDTSSGGTLVAPTSTVFTTNYVTGYNKNGVTQVAYCFAAIPGYSAFGSYTGNGSTDGPFIFTGMRPRWIMVKRTDSASAVGWFIWDTSRASSSGGNVTGYQLYPNSSTSESSQSSDLDILSNGFKLRGTYQDYNTSGGTYIYAAFAENPFQNARAR